MIEYLEQTFRMFSWVDEDNLACWLASAANAFPEYAEYLAQHDPERLAHARTILERIQAENNAREKENHKQKMTQKIKVAWRRENRSLVHNYQEQIREAEAKGDTHETDRLKVELDNVELRNVLRELGKVAE